MRKLLSILLLSLFTTLLVGCTNYIDEMNKEIEKQAFTPTYRHYSHRHYTKGTGKVDYIAKAYDVLKTSGYQIKRDKYTQADSLLQVDNQLYFSFKFDTDGNQFEKNVTYDRAIMKLDLIEETVSIVKVFMKHTYSMHGLNLFGLHQNRYLIYEFFGELIIEDLVLNSIIKKYKPINRMIPVVYIEDTLMVLTKASVELFDFKSLNHASFTMPNNAYVIGMTKNYVQYRIESDIYVDMRQMEEVSKDIYQNECDKHNTRPIKHILLNNTEVVIEDYDDHIMIGDTKYEDSDLLSSQLFILKMMADHQSVDLRFDITLADQLAPDAYLLYIRYYHYDLLGSGSTYRMLFSINSNGEIEYMGYVPLRTYAGKIKL